MKLSVRGEYALRALLVLSQNYGADVVRIQTISEQQNIPKKFLEQILNDLKSLGVVESKRGEPKWRLQVVAMPAKITLASVIRHMTGALAPVSCVSDRFMNACTQARMRLLRDSRSDEGSAGSGGEHHGAGDPGRFVRTLATPRNEP